MMERSFSGKSSEQGVGNMQRLPLEGVRIADFTRVWAGPFTTFWLAALGAEVIKIESTLRPDATRRLVMKDGKLVPTLDPRRGTFVALNCGKKDITLNLTDPRAMELVKEIIKISDVVTENMATGVMDRWGLGYDNLKKLKPDIIMASTSGHGRTGPAKDYVAYAVTVHASGGICSLTGYPGGPPEHIGGAWGDLVSAEETALAVLVALHHRSRTGEGQYIDLSMSEVITTLIPEGIMDYIMNQKVRGRMGNRDDVMAPHNCYPCQGDDRWVAIAVSTDEEWQALCHAMSHPEWIRDGRFADALSRWRNQEELDKLIGQWTRERTNYEVAEALQKVGVAAGPSLNVDELVEDPHLKQRGFFAEVDYPEEGMGKGIIARITGNLGGNYRRPPLIGEHNDYVFRELLGMPEEEIARLTELKVIC